MKKNLKGFLVATHLLFVSGALLSTSLLVKEYENSYLFLIFCSFLVTILLIILEGKTNLTLKEIFNKRLFRILSLIYFSTSIIHCLYALFLLIDNYYYIKTPITILAYYFCLLSIILSYNKFSINLNIGVVSMIFSIIPLFIITIFFPKGELKVSYTPSNINYLFLWSYATIFLDLFYYQLLFKSENFIIKNQTKLYIAITTFFLIFLYSYFDSKIVPTKFLNTFFPNLLKYRISNEKSHIHFDLICLAVIYIAFLFKTVIFGEGIRIFLKVKKRSNFNIFMYVFMYLIAAILIFFFPKDFNLIKLMLIFNSNLAFITIIFLGGILIVKKLHSRKQGS